MTPLSFVENEQDVKKLAYFIWEKNERPDGRSDEFYFRAEYILSFNGWRWRHNIKEFEKRLEKLRAA